MTNLKTENFANYFIAKIQKEFIDKNYTTDWFFDFAFTEEDLPFDYTEENFLKYFKDKFNLKRIEINFFEGKFRCFGKVSLHDDLKSA